jgi:hypothetical protein
VEVTTSTSLGLALILNKPSASAAVATFDFLIFTDANGTGLPLLSVIRPVINLDCATTTVVTNINNSINEIFMCFF